MGTLKSISKKMMKLGLAKASPFLVLERRRDEQGRIINKAHGIS